MSDRGRSWSRREFVGGIVLGGTAGFLGAEVGVAASDLPPETTRLRVLRTPSICEAPAQMAETLLATEGFTEVQYVQVGGSVAAVKGLVAGEIDVGLLAIPGTVLRIDAGDPLVILGGVHAGCFELFGSDRVRSVRDLKGRRLPSQA